ncbi:protein kinase [Mycolicibacterium sp.]|uniref:serine/threonine-protein kinase n=1 Tax=Mycolicibacterium sp. TaxID=2320850 RepID=UPI0037C64AA1
MALNAGEVVAGYTIEGLLGVGGMGRVYRAKHPTLPRSDALKILSAELSHDDQFRVRFLREADLAATLDHPNIVTVYNRGDTEDGQLWIAMQLVAGTDADKELRDKKMTPARAVTIITEVAKALDYAHRRHILHRDVKPANFLLAEDDERIFLADFGIARAVDEAVGLTQTGMVMASVAYAAPETLSGEGVDHRADIYALGCSLYRLLTGKTPFAAGTAGMAAVAAGHLSKPPPRVTDVAPHLPTALDGVVAKAMAKDPAQRYQTATELANAAVSALNDEATIAVQRQPASGGTQQWAPAAPPAPTTPHPQAPPISPPQRYTPPPQPAYQGAQSTDATTYPHSFDSGPYARTSPAGQYSGPPPIDQHARAGIAAAPPNGGRGKKRWSIIGALAAVILVAAGTTTFLLTRGGPPDYQRQTFTHTYGSTDLSAAPTAVAALGPGDADAVLALGMQPVVITAPNGKVPSFEQDKLGDAKVLSFVDTSAIAAAKPDVIIDTGTLDDATYKRLSDIAPTISRPSEGNQAWNWQTQLTWVGRILGRGSNAEELITATRNAVADLKNQNASFGGKTIQAVTVSDSGVSEILTPSNTADYLTSLGFVYNDKLRRGPTDTGSSRVITNTTDLYQIRTDVLVVLRTDAAAGGGGFGGLPNEFNAYLGTMVIVDNPDLVAALDGSGGVLATQFLNANLVPELARQVK